MTRAQYESLPLGELKQIAKTRGMRRISTLRKEELIQRMLEEDEKQQKSRVQGAKPQISRPQEVKEQDLRSQEAKVQEPRIQETANAVQTIQTSRSENGTASQTYTRPVNDGDEHSKKDFERLDSGEEVEGILEVMADGYGLIRSDNFLPGDNDVYVAP